MRRKSNFKCLVKDVFSISVICQDNALLTPYLLSLRCMAGTRDMMYGPLFSKGRTPPSEVLGRAPPTGP